jgi:hypothetical protein
MRTLHAAERHVLAMARAHAIAQAVDAIRAAHRTNQTQAFKDMMLRYEDRMAAALRDLPKEQHAAAIARLREEQAAEATHVAETESAKLRDDEQRARAVIATTYKTASARLMRKQREERLSMTLHLRQGFYGQTRLSPSRQRYRAGTFEKRFAHKRQLRRTGPRNPNSGR